MDLQTATRSRLKPWIAKFMSHDVTRPCIISLYCNLMAIPHNVVKIFQTVILDAVHMKVPIAHGRSYNPIVLTNVDVNVQGITTGLRVSASLGERIFS